MKNTRFAFRIRALIGISVGMILGALLATTPALAAKPTDNEEMHDVSAMCSAILHIVAASAEDQEVAASLRKDAIWFNQWTSTVAIVTNLETLGNALHVDKNEVWPILTQGTGMCLLVKTEAIDAIKKAKENARDAANTETS